MVFAGIDIGGANIKFAILNGDSRQISFPIWKHKEQLVEVLKRLANSLDPDTRLGVTMTAELADCFDDKPTGVEFVVNTVLDAFAKHEPLFYRTDGTMCVAQEAVKQWQLVAASNWHALARLAFSGPECDSGFVFDIGSTTSDIIPVENGSPCIGNQNDYQRLANGQLFYAGVGRTPVCSIVQGYQLAGQSVSTARELFATMSDVFLWLGQLEENATSYETADGRPATKRCAGQRLARMACSDFNELGSAQIDQIASQAKQALVQQLAGAVTQVVKAHPALPLTFKTFGKGAWLVDCVLNIAVGYSPNPQRKVISFSTDETVNQTAAALAVATFRQEVDMTSGVNHG